LNVFAKTSVLAVALGLIFLAAFALWGEDLDRILNHRACVEWFTRVKPYAWALGIGLLVSDLFLPIPATGVMAALGSVYGFVLGGFIAAVGSAGAGLIGYFMARYAGRRAIHLLASEEEIRRSQAFFDRWGGFAVILSRALPILPEVMAILAGVSRMRLSRFLSALLLGTIPTCLLFSYVGHAARSQPAYAVGLAVLASVALWPLFARLISGEAGRRASREKLPL
jgi:uncharacterized membrane protein YdjX (TVP38/TMEM64 family)